MPGWGNRIRDLTIVIAAALAVIVSIRGSGTSPTKNLVTNADFEVASQSRQLPNDWAFNVSSGVYKYRLAKSSGSGSIAHSGNAFLEFGGSGGTVEVVSKPFIVTGSATLNCGIWIKTDFVRNGRVEAFLRPHFSHELLPGSPVARIDVTSRDWQYVRFSQQINSDAVDVSLDLVVRLEGEALVQIDNVTLSNIDHFAPHPLFPEELISDSSFEEKSANGSFPEWKMMSSDKRGRSEAISETPHGGKSCVRLIGASDWSVLTSKRQLSPKSQQFVVQGYVRAKSGIGRIKIDYLKNGRCIASSQSPSASDDWTLVKVESDPVLLKSSDSISVTLAASRRTDHYVVDFDDVSLYVKN